ncbi:hypothetical protein C8J57DRAFT_1247462 [Mycena rebaudengoi]|nr:hypothetical protein C8J57DRAFT_1247462 [Mycena rebaudengoi]
MAEHVRLELAEMSQARNHERRWICQGDVWWMKLAESLWSGQHIARMHCFRAGKDEISSLNRAAEGERATSCWCYMCDTVIKLPFWAVRNKSFRVAYKKLGHSRNGIKRNGGYRWGSNVRNLLDMCAFSDEGGKKVSKGSSTGFNYPLVHEYDWEGLPEAIPPCLNHPRSRERDEGAEEIRIDSPSHNSNRSNVALAKTSSSHGRVLYFPANKPADVLFLGARWRTICKSRVCLLAVQALVAELNAGPLTPPSAPQAARWTERHQDFGGAYMNAETQHVIQCWHLKTGWATSG